MVVVNVKGKLKTISEIIVKHLWDKGQMWPLFTTTTAYAMNTFASEALRVFFTFPTCILRDLPDLTSLSFPKIDTIPVNYCEFIISKGSDDRWIVIRMENSTSSRI